MEVSGVWEAGKTVNVHHLHADLNLDFLLIVDEFVFKGCGVTFYSVLVDDGDNRTFHALFGFIHIVIEVVEIPFEDVNFGRLAVCKKNAYSVEPLITGVGNCKFVRAAVGRRVFAAE